MALPGIHKHEHLLALIRAKQHEQPRQREQQATTQRLPVIMLTAHGREVEREKGLALGADDYVTKPFSTQQLVEKVKSLLGERTP